MKKIIKNKKIIIPIIILVLVIVGSLIYYFINNKNDEFIVGKTLKIADSSDYLVQYEDDSYYLMKANADIKFNVSSEDKEIKYKIVDENDKEIESNVSKNKKNYVIASNKDYEAGKTYKITLENAKFTDEKLKDIKTLYFTIVRPNSNTQVLNDNVIKVDSNIITKVNKDDNYYTITSNKEFKKDDVLYYQNKDEVIAFKVLELKKEDNNYIIKTSAPTLEELFKDLDIYGEFNLKLNDFISNEELKDYIKISIAKNGLLDHIIPNVYAEDILDIDIETGKDGSAKVKVSINLEHGNKSIFKSALENHDMKLDLELIIKLKAHCDITLFKHDIGARLDVDINTDFNINPIENEEYKFNFEEDVNDDISVKAGLFKDILNNAKKDSSKETTLIGKTFVPTPILGLTVDLKIDLLKELELILKADLNIKNNFNILFGHNNKGFYKNFDFSVKNSSYDVLGKAEAKLGLTPRVSINFCRVMEVGVEAPLGIYADGQINYMNSSNKDQIDGKMEIGAFVSAGVYAETHFIVAKVEATFEKKLPIITLEGTIQNMDLAMYSGTYKSMYGDTEELYIKDNKLYYRFSNGKSKEINFNDKKDDGSIIIYEDRDMVFSALYIYPIGVEFSAVNINQDGKTETDKTKIRLFKQGSGVNGIESVYYKDDSTNNCEEKLLNGDFSCYSGTYSDKALTLSKDGTFTTEYGAQKYQSVKKQDDGSYYILTGNGKTETGADIESGYYIYPSGLDDKGKIYNLTLIKTDSSKTRIIKCTDVSCTSAYQKD